MKFIISGAGGFVGGAMIEHFGRRGHEVVRLVRGEITPDAGKCRWNPAAGELDPAVLSGADAVINLNGRNISQGRWTNAVKADLRSSRLDATSTLVNAIARAGDPPAVLVNASATGFYGDRGDEIVDEGSAAGTGFLADLAGDWEAAAESAKPTTRVVLLRLGMVIGNGGALQKMLLPFKLGLGGPMGSGRQWWPWIGMDDVVGVVEHAIRNNRIAGPVNVVAPESVTSRGFARALGNHLGRPAVLPTPAFAVKTALGEMAESLLLASTRVRPKVLEDTGYRFHTPTLAETFNATLG